LKFQDGAPREFWDTWDLYKIGSETLAVSKEEAINTAYIQAQNLSQTN
jgi:hypothetical protein